MLFANSEHNINATIRRHLLAQKHVIYHRLLEM